jgi:hypothetical protein
MLRHTAVVLALVVGGTCSAQTVSIKVADMPLPEVVQLLRDMAGLQIVGDVEGPQNAARITLDMTDVPLKTVIREICRQSGKHFTRFAQGYNLMRGVEDDQRPRLRVGDYDVALDTVTLQRTSSLNLRQPDQGPQVSHQLSFQLVAEADDDELLAAIYAFDPNVAVTTDTGAKLEPTQKQLWGRSYGGSEGEHRARISVSAPPEGTKRIASLEGDIVVYSKLDRVEFEFTPADVGTTKTSGDISLKLVAFDPGSGVVRSEMRIPQPKAEGNPQQLDWMQPRVEVALVDEANRAASWAGSGTSGGAENGVQLWQQQYSFRLDPGFKPAKVRYRVVAPRGPTERLTYLFEDIPLPLEENAKPPLDQLP